MKISLISIAFQWVVYHSIMCCSVSKTVHVLCGFYSWLKPSVIPFWHDKIVISVSPHLLKSILCPSIWSILGKVPWLLWRGDTALLSLWRETRPTHEEASQNTRMGYGGLRHGWWATNNWGLVKEGEWALIRNVFLTSRPWPRGRSYCCAHTRSTKWRSVFGKE